MYLLFVKFTSESTPKIVDPPISPNLCKAYVRESPSPKQPYKVQCLHFRYLKFLLTIARLLGILYHPKDWIMENKNVMIYKSGISFRNPPGKKNTLQYRNSSFVAFKYHPNGPNG